MKSVFKNMIDGELFELASSKANPVQISIDNKMVSVFKEGECLHRKVAVESVQGDRNIFLENGCMFISSKSLTNDEVESLISRTEGWFRYLDLFSFKTATIFIIILIILVGSYRYVFVSFSSTIVKLFPYEWEQQIGKATFSTLSRTILQESELSSYSVNHITRESQHILKEANLPFRPEVKFMKSDIIGPNALALPGGPIIVTDALVELLKDDALILSVIAHEIAHVKQRHSLQQLVEIVGLSSLAWLVFGLDEGILEEIALVGVNLWVSKKSRDFEKESDLIALELLGNAGLEKASFILAIEKLTNHFCMQSKSEKAVCLQDVKSGWLSTHPSGSERLRYLREQIE